MNKNLFLDYEIFLEITDKLIHQRFINLLIEHKIDYIKKDIGFVIIKNCYWDLPKPIQQYLDNEDTGKHIKWI